MKRDVAALTDDIDLLTDTGRDLAAYIVSQPTLAERYDLMVAVLWSLLECLAPPLTCSHPLGAAHVARLAAKARAERAARKLREPPTTTT